MFISRNGGQDLNTATVSCAPRSVLANYISHITIRQRSTIGGRLLVLPGAEARLVFRYPTTGNGRTGDWEGDIFLIGAPTGIYAKDVGAHAVINVHFKPAGAYPFFGVSMGSVTGQYINLENLWGSAARDLHTAMGRALTYERRLNLLQDALCARLNKRAPGMLRSVHTAARVVDLISSTGIEQNLPLDHIAPELQKSPRHLRRLFAEIVGLSTHELIRVRRFNHAIHRARVSPTARWAEIAVDSGYYDQAHMIGEFKKFSGLTPAALYRYLQEETVHRRATS